MPQGYFPADKALSTELNRLWGYLDALRATGASPANLTPSSPISANTISLSVATPSVVGILAGSSGSSEQAERAGHIHSFSVNVVAADPGSPADGDMWYRSDLQELRIRVAGTTRKVVFT